MKNLISKTRIFACLFISALLLTGCNPKVEKTTAEPSAVSDFKAVKGNQQVKLSWKNPSADSFEKVVIYSGDSEDDLSDTTEITDKSTSYTVSGLSNNQTYYFKASAYFTGTESPYDSDIISATPTDDLSSVEFAKELVIGWNLGNTLDAPTETGWGMPKTTQEMINAVKAAGFETIRIPVSWSEHVDSSYNINSDWMNRVKEVVDYAVNNDMYIILNVHHDNYSEKDLSDSDTYGFALSSNSTLQTKSKAYLEKVWTQIATKFASYDEKLIFEVLNEPRAVGTSDEWYITSASTAKTYCDIITDYENTCISAIRAVSGNEDRYIMVPSYAASGTMTVTLDNYTLPDDSASDKLILSTHAYSPYNFAMANADSTFDSDDEASLTSIFNYLKTNYTDKGIGVVMGEASASNKDNTSERIKWAEDYFAKAESAGIPVVLWDNMVYTADGSESTESGYNGEHHGWLNRNACKWYFPTIIQAMMDTVGVSGYSIPEYVVPTVSNIGWDASKATTVSTNESTLSWGTDYKLDKSYFANATEGSILKVTFSASGAAIKLINSSWTTYSDGTIVNGSASDGVITVSDTDLYYVLTSSDASAWKSQDMYIAGQNGTVTGVYFQASVN
jgi:endoglucanase